MNKQIGAAGFKLLAEGLEENARLRILNFSDTSPGKEGGIALRQSLWKQYKNTKKLIEQTTKALKECTAIQECVKDNDIDIFSDDLIGEIIGTFVGYVLLEQLDLKNCYPNLLEPGVGKLVELMDLLRGQGHELKVVW